MEKYIVLKPCRTNEQILLINGDIIYAEEKECQKPYKIFDIYSKETRKFIGYLFIEIEEVDNFLHLEK